jgi:dienelactone hydrolase
MSLRTSWRSGPLLLAWLLLTICLWPSVGGSQNRPRPLFGYDRSLPLDLREMSTQSEGGITIRDVTFASIDPRHGPIEAFIVRPPGSGPFAGILYFHWLGKPRGDRTEFLEEAVALATHGVVSVLVQGYFPWKEPPKDGPSDRQQVIDQVIDTRRAMDVLVAQPGVDVDRLGYVGHDYGAMYGAILAAVDARAKAYVLVAGLGDFGAWSLKYWPHTAAAGEAVYRKTVADVDPINFIALASPASLLFQFAKRDIYISEAAAAEFFDQASAPKDVRWYDAEHDLHIEAAARDRNEWLRRQLIVPRP